MMQTDIRSRGGIANRFRKAAFLGGLAGFLIQGHARR